MKVKVKIEGLDCPNCARTLQEEINKLEGVKNCSIEFIKNSLTFESEKPQIALERIKALTKQLEPQAKITEKESSGNKMLIVDVVTLALGIGLGVLLIFLKLPTWAYWTIYCASALLLGYKTYWRAIRLLFKGVINENMLITISVIGASILGQFVKDAPHNSWLNGLCDGMEGLMVIALYSIGKIFEGLAVNKSRKSIQKLAQTQPEYANILVDGQICSTSPSDVKLGSIIVVRAGEKVPIDGIIIKGRSMIDNQSLTGESVPVSKNKGDEILSGGIVVDGVLQIKTTALYKDSAISKIMDLVENANENKSKTETVISKLTRWYTLGVVVCAILVWGILWGVTKDLGLSFSRALVFLVVSCPCAFAISVPLSYFSGLGNASKNGILIKGSNYLDACAGLKLVAFDKTGTLTSGEFAVKKIQTYGKFSQKDILYFAALGEQNSLHPLAKAIKQACKKKLEQIEDSREVGGKGVEYVFNGKKYFVGRKSKNVSATVVEVYQDEEKIGQIELSDTIKPTSKQACEQLKKLGVNCALLSGDNQESANIVSNQVGIKDVHSGLLPEQKYAYLKESKVNMRVGYVGDGINDAPSLALADVGFSMGINGAPASIEASDVVIVDDNPEKISTAIKISRYTRKIVWENIILSAVIKITFLTLCVVGVTGMLAAVFADVGVTVLAILNSLRALYYKPNKNKNKAR